MKKTFLLVVLLTGTLSLFAQDYSQLSKIKMTTPSDYFENEYMVEECANYILDQRIGEYDQNQFDCITFIMRWMEGASEYTFTLGPDYTNFCKKSNDLTFIYMVSMAKAAVDSDYSEKDADSITKNANEIFLNYCSNPKHGVKMNKVMKEALKEIN